MLTIRRVLNVKHTYRLSVNTSRRALSALIIATAIVGISGCGQKGDLYLVDNTSSNTVGSALLSDTDDLSETALASDEQNSRELEIMLADVNEDPNDY
ncbi:LPS translocon maturation chaperone LptM [Psychrobacter sp. AOP42-A1-21]|uniref:LPS translocon maturation chaperone LptM n=1 Tax=unclassified Psychrobacter TaxID=196806 RepID=UPI003FDBB17C